MSEEEKELVEVMAGVKEVNAALMAWRAVHPHDNETLAVFTALKKLSLRAVKAAGYTITRSARNGISHEREGFEGEPTP